MNRTIAIALSHARIGTFLMTFCIVGTAVLAQQHDMHDMHDMQHMHDTPSTTQPATQPARPMHDMHDMTGMHHDMHNMGTMPGLIWSSMNLESSGTSWQPASTPMPYPMIHIMPDDPGGWMWMMHGDA